MLIDESLSLSFYVACGLRRGRLWLFCHDYRLINRLWFFRFNWKLWRCYRLDLNSAGSYYCSTVFETTFMSLTTAWRAWE
jgi:hypothetical protein